MFRRNKSQTGFTIVELSIASSAFAVLLLVGLVAFVQTGRSYYKGVTISQTRTISTNILNEISGNIRLSSSVSGLNTATANRYYYCIGTHRYTFQLFNMVDTSNHDNSTKFGLLEDTLPGSGGCGNPFDAPVVPLSNPTELLANQMRLLSFSITLIAGHANLYDLSLKVADGVDNSLTATDSPDAQCKTGGGGTQFCAITNLNTVIYEGI